LNVRGGRLHYRGIVLDREIVGAELRSVVDRQRHHSSAPNVGNRTLTGIKEHVSGARRRRRGCRRCLDSGERVEQTAAGVAVAPRDVRSEQLSARRVALHAAQQGNADCRGDYAWPACVSFCADSSPLTAHWTSGVNCLAGSLSIPHRRSFLNKVRCARCQSVRRS